MIPQVGQEFIVDGCRAIILSIAEIHSITRNYPTYNIFYFLIKANYKGAIIIREEQFHPGCPIIPRDQIGKVFYWKSI